MHSSWATLEWTLLAPDELRQAITFNMPRYRHSIPAQNPHVRISMTHTPDPSHLHPLFLRATIPPLLPHKPHKLIQTARPRPILTPPPHRLILQTLPRKHGRLLPHILADALFPFRGQVLDPVIEPGRGFGVPFEGRRGEEEAPVFEGCVERKGTLAWCQGEAEGVFVGLAEEALGRGGGGGEGGAEVGEGGFLVREGGGAVRWCFG